MGGKRPDQYRIDPDEGRTSDHKFMPNEPAEADVQDRLYSEVMESSIKASQPIPPSVLGSHPKGAAKKRAADESPAAEEAAKPRRKRRPGKRR